MAWYNFRNMRRKGEGTMDGMKMAMASMNMGRKKISQVEITARHKKETEGEQNTFREECGQESR